MTAGGYCVVNAALKFSTFTTALKEAITKKTVEVVYGEETKKNSVKGPRIIAPITAATNLRIAA